ncbi:MAG: type I restriction enzyme HsdR N-terminal domain-containing protein [Alphaproteobacteria bacterium]|nr:type I restriction enzyme HsdR N-terminal domain-containing protein [Alphaproteobacteria bacterium]
MALLRNEQDVREEIATPFLKALGYESGTANDIIREHRLRYAAMQLGRKKQNDLPLPQGGDADYLLTVAGATRWILETKPPDQEITRDDIDQATSYARHPEVSGHYAGVLNGRRFVLYHSSQTSNDEPLLDLTINSGPELAQALAGF